MDLNEIGDFLAGTFAPLAFLWFVVAYWQQSDELRLATREMQRQADSIEENTRHAGRDILLRYAELVISSLQFKAVQLVVSLRRNESFAREKDAITKSHDAYYAGDKDACLRRLGILIKKYPLIFQQVYSDNSYVPVLTGELVGNFRNLCAEVAKSDGENGSLLSFYEKSLYGDVVAVISFALPDQGFEFRTRAGINALDEVII